MVLVDRPPGILMEDRTATPTADVHVEARSSQQFQATVPLFLLLTERATDRAPRT